MLMGEFGRPPVLPSEGSPALTTPMYWMYEMAYASLNPARAVTDATKILFQNPLNPWSYTEFGKSIAEFQAVQHQIARAATDVHAARLMVYEAARRRDAGHPFLTEAAMAKIHSSEVAERITSLAVNLFGGYGFVNDYPVEKLMRDARAFEALYGDERLGRVLAARAAQR